MDCILYIYLITKRNLFRKKKKKKLLELCVKPTSADLSRQNPPIKASLLEVGVKPSLFSSAEKSLLCHHLKDEMKEDFTFILPFYF